MLPSPAFRHCPDTKVCAAHSSHTAHKFLLWGQIFQFLPNFSKHQHVHPCKREGLNYIFLMQLLPLPITLLCLLPSDISSSNTHWSNRPSRKYPVRVTKQAIGKVQQHQRHLTSQFERHQIVSARSRCKQRCFLQLLKGLMLSFSITFVDYYMLHASHFQRPLFAQQSVNEQRKHCS